MWSALPFAGMLLSIALLPLLAPHLWHHHFAKVTAGWSLALALPFVAAFGWVAVHEILHTAISDYVPFLILVSTLFTIGGGIYVRGSLRGSPSTNVALLGVGALLASWIGTTGAAMVMIRPLLRANRARHHRAHTVVFFIFLVANVGGLLTPLGDPPLFLGFLHGVPFFWTFGLWREWLVTATIVMAIYAAIDTLQWRRESPAVRAPSDEPHEPIAIEGLVNLPLLLGVIVAVVLSGVVDLGEVSLFGVHEAVANLARDATLLALLAVSWRLTPASVRKANDYSWAPIREVAILFAGIFVTMIPALDMLRAGEHGALAFVVRAVESPAQFFWASGILSSFLDNAPTYLTFLSTALGRMYPGMDPDAALHKLIAEHPIYLEAISTGSVFMGANSYIGNAPNFMVKSIAEEAGVEMPSFFGYIFRFSLPFLVTVFLVVTWLFYR